MQIDLADACAALDVVAIARDDAFQRMLSGKRLRCKGADGVPDDLDDLSARLAVSAMRSHPCGALLIVLPDARPRRAAVTFVTALVADAFARMRARSQYGMVLYISMDPRVRAQLQAVTLGGIGLGTVFTQHYAKGDVSDARPISTAGGLHLPRVLVVCAPADPNTVLRTQRPLWVALDLEDGARVEWLPGFLAAAKKSGTPIIAWTSSPFGPVLDDWRNTGGAVFGWPRFKSSSLALDRPFREEQLASVTLTPRVLNGDAAMRLASEFVTATEALVAARRISDGRLCTDALAVGWRLLRTLEGLPVRLEDYENEADHHWGAKRVGTLQSTLTRFVDAVSGSPRAFSQELEVASIALERAIGIMREGAAPAWEALANQCVDEGPKTVVFASRSRKEIFRQCLLSRYNIAEDDLAVLNTRLRYVSEPMEPDERNVRFVFHGLPSGDRSRHFGKYVDGGQMDVVLWPHQTGQLIQHARHLGTRMSATVYSLESALGGLGRVLSRPVAIEKRPLQLVAPIAVGGGAILAPLPSPSTVSLWKRPDLAATISGLFQEPANDDYDDTVPDISEDDDQDLARPADLWVPSAIEVTLTESHRLLLASDDTINVISRTPGQPKLDPRYARGLRPGDEVLLIRGQHRQTLYELLISRVHRNPTIDTLVQLVQRWQDEFARAFALAQATNRLTEDRLLAQLQSSGSGLTSAGTIRTWVRRSVLAPNDADDLLRVADVLSLPFVKKHYKRIHAAGRRLKGLHINLSARLNRWLASGDAVSVTRDSEDDIVDADLGLTLDDFRHSLLRLTVVSVRTLTGRFYRGNLGLPEEVQ